MEKKSEQGHAKGGQRDDEIRPSDYLRAVRTHLRNDRQKDAHDLLLQATVQYPDEPLILSYFGCMQALVGKKFRNGVETCKRAIQLLKEKETFSEEILFPVFYLNLGRAYVAAGRKKDAIDSFKKGLKYDNGNSDLHKELHRLGVRKQAPVPFLDRSNPINKNIGIVLHSAKRSADGKSGTRGR